MLNRKILPAITTAALVAFGGFSSQAFAADAATQADVNIVAPLRIQQVASLDFGDVGPDFDNDTTVVLTSGGVISSPNGAGLFGNEARGQFNVTGQPNEVYVITDPVTVNLGAANLDVTAFRFTANGCANVDAASCNATLSGAGADTLYVGASLNVPANQGVGGYTGLYTLEVQYQ